MKSAIQASEDVAAMVTVSPTTRVSKADIEAKIIARKYIRVPNPTVAGEGTLTLCVVTVENGFQVVGKSAPADAKNFNVAAGRQFAYEDAFRQLWPLEGYLMREMLRVPPKKLRRKAKKAQRAVKKATLPKPAPKKTVARKKAKSA